MNRTSLFLRLLNDFHKVDHTTIGRYSLYVLQDFLNVSHIRDWNLQAVEYCFENHHNGVLIRVARSYIMVHTQYLVGVHRHLRDGQSEDSVACSGRHIKKSEKGIPSTDKVTMHKYPLHDKDLCEKWVRVNPQKEHLNILTTERTFEHSTMCSLNFKAMI